MLHQDVLQYSFDWGYDFKITSVYKSQLKNYAWLVAPILDQAHKIIKMGMPYVWELLRGNLT